MTLGAAPASSNASAMFRSFFREDPARGEKNKSELSKVGGRFCTFRLLIFFFEIALILKKKKKRKRLLERENERLF